MATLFHGATIFDGQRLLPGSLLVENGQMIALLPPGETPAGARTVDLAGGIVAPGFVDLQVNGGGGVMLNDNPAPETLSRMIRAHERLGTLTLLPTLITDKREVLHAAVDAAESLLRAGAIGIAGLHLEGPHLSLARKGAHDLSLIRPMTDDDLGFLIAARGRLPHLMVTVAPESVSLEQIAKLRAVGIVVALGHTDARFADCQAALGAGATVVTHLFNAMSQLASRDPGLVGAALCTPDCSAGLIADGIHVDPTAIALALRAKSAPGQIFLVTDAMAPAGSEIREFTLNDRTIRRDNGRLTLADGTLAGADIDMAGSLRMMTRQVGLPLDRALAMATSIPARVLGCAGTAGHLIAGRYADFVHLSGDLDIRSVWRRGVHL